MDINIYKYKADTDRLNQNFSYIAPRSDQVPRYQIIRSTGKVFANELMRLCPPSRELSIAMTKLEEVVMWANAAIARNEVVNSETEEEGAE